MADLVEKHCLDTKVVSEDTSRNLGRAVFALSEAVKCMDEFDSSYEDVKNYCNAALHSCYAAQENAAEVRRKMDDAELEAELLAVHADLNFGH